MRAIEKLDRLRSTLAILSMNIKSTKVDYGSECVNTRDGRDVTQVSERVASRVKTRLSPIYVHEVLFVCEIAFGVSCHQALLSSQTGQ